MNQDENKFEKIKSFTLTLVFALVVLVLVVMIINLARISNHNIVGRAFYSPIKIYGNVIPELPDGTEISFKVGNQVIASTSLKNNSYGHDPELYFEMDDPSTTVKEGYDEGDIINIYVAGVDVNEFSYISSVAMEKNIIIPSSKRSEVSTKAAYAAFEKRCVPQWSCGVWSDCVDGLQKRVCVDIMGCGIGEGRVTETKNCEAAAGAAPERSAEAEINVGSLITIVGVLLALVLMVVIIIVLIKRQMKPRLPKKAKSIKKPKKK
jgi:Ca2+/Na+ antiporter